jgi:hypothetical protein
MKVEEWPKIKLIYNLKRRMLKLSRYWVDQAKEGLKVNKLKKAFVQLGEENESLQKQIDNLKQEIE